MILSISRRTDIPAFYTRWLQNRLKEGCIYSVNPYNSRQVRKIALEPGSIDGIVFWSKNPKPLLSCLDQIDRLECSYYFQFTLNPYGTEIETNLPPLKQRIETFCRLSDKLGKNRVVWRYDPILLNTGWTIERHAAAFAEIAGQLQGYTDQCIISFIDLYQSTKRHSAGVIEREITPSEMAVTARLLLPSAKSSGLTLTSCCEPLLNESSGIRPAACVDKNRFEKISGRVYPAKKAPPSRPDCRCMPSIDVGAYDTCMNQCIYCYANHSKTLPAKRFEQHDPNAPLLTSSFPEGL